MTNVYEFTEETMAEDLEKQGIELTPKLEGEIISKIEFLGCINSINSFAVGQLGAFLLKQQYGINTYETKLE